jgi:hypothetical protein
MRTALFSLSIFFFTFSHAQLSCKVNEVDSFESKTNYSELEYDTSNVIIKICKHYPNHRSDFSIIYGEPAPKVHAYIYENDSLIKFHIVSYELYYIDSIGNQKRLHPSSGNTITNQCKIVLSSIEEIEDTKNIYFQNVYLQDPNGNVLLFKEKRNLYDIHYKEKDDEE